MIPWLYIFIGGGVGSICRYAISQLISTDGHSFPMGTFVANILACIVLGFLLGMQLNGELRINNGLLLMTGFCGGFSTFSTFSAEGMQLIQNDHLNIALVYIASSIILGVLAVFIGVKLQNAL